MQREFSGAVLHTRQAVLSGRELCNIMCELPYCALQLLPSMFAHLSLSAATKQATLYTCEK